MNKHFNRILMVLKFLPFYLISLLPFWCLYFFADILFFLIYHLFGYRKRVVRENLVRSFPQKSSEEIKKIEVEFYRHFADVVFEAVKVLNLPQQEFAKRYHIVNLEWFEKCEREKTSVIACGSHHGNWEWFTFISARFRFRPILAFYQKLENAYLDDFFKHLRGYFGAECVESGQAFRHLLKAKNEHGAVWSYVIADQSPHPNSPICWVNFLGQPTAFFIGVQKLAERTNAKLVFPHYRKMKRGYYQIEMKEIFDRKKVVENYAKLLEIAILESPHLWLWTHRRWKKNAP